MQTPPTSPCPRNLTAAATVPAGCPCNPARDANLTFGACESGYVCAQPWALQVAAAQAVTRSLLEGDLPARSAPGFQCTPCAYGQLCPRGSYLPPVTDPAIQLALNDLSCPEGWYCPHPASSIRCPQGYFCPPSTIQPVTCNVSLLVSGWAGGRGDGPARVLVRHRVLAERPH